MVQPSESSVLKMVYSHHPVTIWPFLVFSVGTSHEKYNFWITSVWQSISGTESHLDYLRVGVLRGWTPDMLWLVVWVKRFAIVCQMVKNSSRSNIIYRIRIRGARGNWSGKLGKYLLHELGVTMFVAHPTVSGVLPSGANGAWLEPHKSKERNACIIIQSSNSRGHCQAYGLLCRANQFSKSGKLTSFCWRHVRTVFYPIQYPGGTVCAISSQP